MLIEKIKEEAKNKKVIMFFDMDGTIAEYSSADKDRIINNEVGFYLKKRPLHCMLKIMKKFSKMENVTVAILSNCKFEEQKQDKIAWLRIYAPYIKEENIHIVVLSKEVYEKEQKFAIKARYLEKLSKGYDVVYQIEDDQRIINATRNAQLPNTNAEHVSMLLR